MWYKHAAKLQSGDQVHVRKNYTGWDRAMSAKVLNVYKHTELHNTMMVDVLLENGVYIANLTHRDLV